MKKNTFSTLLLCCIFASLLLSCKKNNDQPAPPVVADNSLPSGAVLNFKLLSKSGTTLQYSLDVAVFRDSKNMETQLNAGNFSIDTLVQTTVKYYFSRSGVNLTDATTQRAYSALMLMDQSGSISSTDPSNYRLEAAKAFCENLGATDKVMLWSFSGSSAKSYGTTFTSDGKLVLPFIEGLRGKETGSTPLYSSQYSVTNFCADNASSAGKAVMTFTDGANTESGYTSDQVISNAIAKKVQLFNVGLGSAQVAELSRQSAATGGAFMFARNARQLISMFGNLGKLLNNTARYYHTTWQVNRSAGTFSTGTISASVNISLPSGGSVLVPFTIDY